MTSKLKLARIVFGSLGFAVLAGLVMTITAADASASGYAFGSGIDGEIICYPSVDGDCPESAN